MRALLFLLMLSAPAIASAQSFTRDLVFEVRDMDWKVRETDTEIRIDLSADVLFDFDKSDVKPEAKPTLARLVAEIREHAPKGTVRIEGHTDAIGKDAYNQALSERRAGAVCGWLAANGLKDLRFETRGFGAKVPIAPNDTPENRQKNRRVEIVLTK
jgi:outer membrane protein OmpA-like peptidoglycan-associated protein